MSCESSPISTIWTTTTSDVPVTTTSVHTTVTTPPVSVITSIATSCLATRSSASLPTARLHVSGRTDGSAVIGDSHLAVPAVDQRASNPRKEREGGPGPRNPSLWALLVAARELKRDILAPRQIPSGLPSDCVSWTFTSSLSTPAVTPSTMVTTSTVITTTQTTLSMPKETIWASCDGIKSTDSASSQTPIIPSSDLSAAPSTSVASASEVSPSETPSQSSIESSSTDSAYGSESDPPLSTASDIPPSTAGLTPTSAQWIDETSKFDSTTSFLSASGIDSTTTIDAGVLTQNATVAATSTGSSLTPVDPVVVFPTATSDETPVSGISTSSSTRTQATANVTLSADTNAATQGALAVDNGRDKAVSVGATIGGIIGLFGLIALMLMGIRYYMRWKRGNKRKTLKMRQSWYPPGYDGPDHIAVPTNEKHGQVPDHSHFSFFSLHGKNAISSDAQDQSRDTPRPFPRLQMPRFDIPFLSTFKDDRNVVDDQDSNRHDALGNRFRVPVIFAGALAKIKQTRMFPAFSTPSSSRKAQQDTSEWTEKYLGEPSGPTPNASPIRNATNRDVNPPRSIMMRPPDFDGVVGPPRLNCEPAAHHWSWGLPRDASGPKALAGRTPLEWGHSYAAPTINPDPRLSVMPRPPLPEPFTTGPFVPPSPTEGSVYSNRQSQHSRISRQSTRQSRRSTQNRYSVHSSGTGPGHGIQTSAAGLDGQPSDRVVNPDIRSVIISRASVSAASIGGWSTHSGTSEHSLPPLPEGGLRFDFPLPPSAESRAATMVSVPEPRALQSHISRPPVPKRGTEEIQVNMQSSIFEYDDYARQSTDQSAPAESVRSGAVERDTIRQTASWYKKPLWIWDGQSGPVPRDTPDQDVLSEAGWGRDAGTRGPADNVPRAL